MKKRLIAGISLGVALFASAALIAVPAVVLNTTVPSIGHAQEKVLKGQILYKQRSALPMHATITVQLVDISDEEAPAKIVNETKFEPSSQAPFAFILPVKMENFIKGHQYALQARISVGDALWFVSEEKVPVTAVDIDQTYEISLEQVKQSNNTLGKRPEIKGEEWLAEDIFGGGVMDYSHITLKINENAEASNLQDETKYRVSGTGGCNRYTAMATLNEQTRALHFDIAAMTFMMCTESVSQQENRFIDMLTKVRSYEFDDGGRLFFKNSDNDYIGRFTTDD